MMEDEGFGGFVCGACACGFHGSFINVSVAVIFVVVAVYALLRKYRRRTSKTLA